jgi:Fur family transcriptional regulator, ferric uptake regulator
MSEQRRNTWQKQAVRHALNEGSGFVSAQMLHTVLKNHGSSIGLATVYRALNELASSGEADSLQSSEGEMLYRACGQEHHHHLICRKCGETKEIEANLVESWAEEVAKANGYSSPSHTIDIFGTCISCQKKLAN